MLTGHKTDILWGCTSVGCYVSSFILHAIPYMEFIALLLSIASGIKVLISWRRHR